MCTTVLERKDVVNFLRRGDAAVQLALLTQRVGCKVSVANLSPPMVVASIDLRVPLVTPVGLFLLSGVGWAEPLVR